MMLAKDEGALFPFLPSPRFNNVTWMVHDHEVHCLLQGWLEACHASDWKFSAL